MRKLSLMLALLTAVLCFDQLSAQSKTNNQDTHIASQVKNYLKTTENTYVVGQHAYYARKSLSHALTAFNEGNYGIGAVVLLVHDGTIYEFSGRNAMVTGSGIMDHAEARALEDAVAYKDNILSGHKNKFGVEMNEDNLLRSNLVMFDDTYSTDTNAYTRQFKNDGYYVYGTLEPCPMCMVMILNAQAERSISSAIDGRLVQNEFLGKDSNQLTSNGGAMAIGEKFKYNPFVWQWIAGGQKLKFEQLETEDKELIKLSEKIFSKTRVEIDNRLGAE